MLIKKIINTRENITVYDNLDANVAPNRDITINNGAFNKLTVALYIGTYLLFEYFIQALLVAI